MEWIRISNNKLKIMLTAEDARRYALSCEKADYADLLTREAFRDILSDMRDKTGFDATEDKLYIQMYPSKEGGCELFVTKMGLLLAESDCEEDAIPPPEKQEPKAQKRTPFPRKRSVAFLFDELSHLISLCQRLRVQSYIGESEVWKDEHGQWWLILTEIGNPLTSKEDYRFIREYARMFSAEEARLLLPEHGKLLCPKNAVSIFSRL